MISWLDDHVTLLYFLLGCAVLVLVVVWWLNRRTKYVAAAGVVVLLIVLLWLLSTLNVSDREQIQATILEMAQGVQDGKPELVIRNLAADFNYEGKQKEDFSRQAEAIIRQQRVRHIHLWDFDFEEFNSREGKAKLAFRARADFTHGEMTMVLVRAHFVRQGERWKMKTFQIYNAVVNTDQPLQIFR